MMDAKSENESPGPNTWVVIVGILVLVGAGGAYWSGVFDAAPEEITTETEVAAQAPDEAVEEETPTEAEVTSTEPQQTEPTADQPQTTEQTANQAEPEATDGDAPPQVAAEATPPTLDQIFVEPDGNAVLSGNAEPGAVVRVLLDGEAVHSFTVDGSGQFAEFVSIPFSNTARGLTLETDAGEEPLRSDDYLIAALPEPQVETPALENSESGEAQTDVAQESNTEIDEAAPTETAEASIEPQTEQTAQTAEPQTEQTAEPQAEQTAQTAEAAPEAVQNQQVTVLRSGEDGVELVQPPASQAGEAEQVALDTIGYSDEGEVELTGRVPDGSVVRLYLNNRLVADLPPADDGKWRSELEGVDPGVYTLRVDEVGSDGTVVSRLETPFKREPLEVLRASDAPDSSAEQSTQATIRSVTVQEGDTLWAISRERYGDGILFVRLFDANRDSIRDPDLIYPGQVFTIPE
ncbi:LysM peptidoglycan-binding domain-containing protein [Ruegeria sp. THAF57]|uniref:LysM peptidoglycan-binding domain-containing protein n=1 Tax=Ruegeria sp. THAF57 TaxID=2744555 RepID=UPI0021075FE1|nr:LysM peptidoglycan-binding domain-containing protein [Ruegeria sp. THAF57]